MPTIITPAGGRIQTNEGTWNDKIDTDLNDLMQNQLIEPARRLVLGYAQKRMLMTLITSGSVGQFGVQNIPTKVKDLVAKAGNATVGSKGYQFTIQGRIQRSIEIVSQLGQTLPNGTFTLVLKDRVYEGMNCLFNGQGFQARAMTNPQGGPGNWIVDFQPATGVTFSWATHVAPQGSVKTLFAGNTSYGAGSLKGYSDDNFPDTFINYTTTARKTDVSDSDADSQVLRITYTEPTGGKSVQGWLWKRIQRNNAVFLMEHEWAAWMGESTMKGANGQPLSTPRLIDRYTNKPIVTGDGVIPQIDGGNRAYGSGANGLPMASDFVDMVKLLRSKSNNYIDTELIVVTDLEGMKNFQFNICPGLSILQNITMFQNVNADGKESTVGINFMRANIMGTWITVIEHPMFSDKERFSVNASTGLTSMDCTYIFLNVADTNVEMLDKGGNGYSRGTVEGWYQGLTGRPGSEGKAVTEEDSTKYARLVEKMTNVYYTESCGILSR